MKHLPTYSRAINKRAYPALVANEAETALALIGDTSADLPITHAILGLKLAETSGLQLLPHLLAANTHLKVVVQTGYANIAATARALGMHRRTLQRKLQKRPLRS